MLDVKLRTKSDDKCSFAIKCFALITKCNSFRNGKIPSRISWNFFFLLKDSKTLQTTPQLLVGQNRVLHKLPVCYALCVKGVAYKSHTWSRLKTNPLLFEIAFIKGAYLASGMSVTYVSSDNK